MDGTKLIDEIIAAKKGDKEFALEFTPQGIGEWRAAIGNASGCVSLAEALQYGDDGAEFVALGSTAAIALKRLQKMVENGANKTEFKN